MRWFVGCVFLVLVVLVTGCSDSDPTTPDDDGDPVDETAPAAVTDLQVQSISETAVMVTWTSPGDDGTEGSAATYDIRYAALPLTETSWPVCNRVVTPPAPLVAGTQQLVQIQSPPQPDVYIALKAVDEAGNWSGMSNVAHGRWEPGLIEVHQLTSEGPNDYPCVDDGVASWVGWYDGEDEIFVANLRTASPTPTKLTDNGGEKRHPSNHGSEKIVWQGRADGIDDWEIFEYYKYASPPRFSAFTDNEIDDMYPVLAGAGDFAWLQGHIMYEAVHYWDEDGKRELVISDDCCPTTSWANEPPAADDHQVIWRAWDRSGGSGHRGYLWDGTLTDLTPLLGVPLSVDYDIHDGAIAYETGASPTWIACWDGTGEPQLVAEGYSPSIYDGTIAYEVFDGHDWEIRYWDGSQVVEITDNDYNDTQPCLDDGIIVWLGRSGNLDQVFYAVLPE